MRQKLLSAFIILFLTQNVAFTIPTRADDEQYPDHNTAIVDGKAWDLSTLGLTQPTLNQLVPSGDVAKNLKALQDSFRVDFAISFVNSKKIEFFDDILAAKPGEIVLVTKLPTDCIFTPPENLPPGVTTVNVGCTKGQITYLVPSILQKMDDTQKALLLIHERLHALAPGESFEVKTDIVKACSILLSRFFPAIKALPAAGPMSPRVTPTPATVDAKGSIILPATPPVMPTPSPGTPSSFRFTDDELAIMNRLSTRIEQITHSGGALQTVNNLFFTQDGGYLSGFTTNPDPSSVQMDLGSRILFAPLSLFPYVLTSTSNLVVTGYLKMTGQSKITWDYTSKVFDVRLNNVTLDHVSINTGAISLDNSAISHSTITGELKGSNTKINYSWLQFAVENSRVVRPTLYCPTGTQGTVANAFIQDAEFRGTICAADLSFVQTSTFAALYDTSALISGDAIHFFNSTMESVFSGNGISVESSSVSASNYISNGIKIQYSMSANTVVKGFSEFTQVATTLSGVDLESAVTSVDASPAHLDHAEFVGDYYSGQNKWLITIEPNTTFVHGVLASSYGYNQKNQLDLGTAGQVILMDGHDKTYAIKTNKISNQTDLDQNGQSGT
jgi:hypothetical protein